MAGVAGPSGAETAAAAASALLSAIPCHKVPDPEVSGAVRHVAAMEHMLGAWGAQVGRACSGVRFQLNSAACSAQLAGTWAQPQACWLAGWLTAVDAEVCSCRGVYLLQSLPSADLLVNYFHLKVRSECRPAGPAVHGGSTRQQPRGAPPQLVPLPPAPTCCAAAPSNAHGC